MLIVVGKAHHRRVEGKLIYVTLTHSFKAQQRLDLPQQPAQNLAPKHLEACRVRRALKCNCRTDSGHRHSLVSTASP